MIDAIHDGDGGDFLMLLLQSLPRPRGATVDNILIREGEDKMTEVTPAAASRAAGEMPSAAPLTLVG